MKLSFETLSKPQMLAWLPWLQPHQEEGEMTGTMQWMSLLRVSQTELEKQRRELQEARRHLEKAHERYAEFYDSVPVGYITLDETGRVLEINPAAAALLSRERSAVMGKHFIAWLADGNSRNFFDHLRQVFSSRNKVVCNIGVKDPKGIPHTMLLESMAVEDAEKGYICQMLMTDATGHNKTEQLLALAARVIANTSEGIMITDGRGVILSVNPAFENATGYTACEVFGQTAGLLRPNHHDENFYRQMLSALQDNGQWQGEIWNRRKNGEVCRNCLSTSAVKDKHGKVTHYVSIYSDAPDEKYLLDRLQYFAFYDTYRTSQPSLVYGSATAGGDVHRYG
jgi:PAS domain S-box-containing protein